jgi:hypothetical protein
MGEYLTIAWKMRIWEWMGQDTKDRFDEILISF